MRKFRERPRTTKNIYFFKAGDQTFPGVRLPVNNRKYRTLGAVLDDLTYRIPLPRGVRNLSTPHGRDRVTDLAQLRHMGSYICSDLIQTKRVPGVNLSQMKGFSDNELIWSSNNNSYQGIRAPPPKKLKRVIKKKKRKRKKKKAVSGDQGLVAMIQERILDTARSDSPDFEAVNNRRVEDVYPDIQELRNSEENEDVANKAAQTRRRTSSEVVVDSREYGGVWVGEDDQETGNRGGEPSANPGRTATAIVQSRMLSAPRQSRPTTSDAVKSRGMYQSEKQKSLSPLDDNKLAHVQRRRLASNQVDAERYSLPSGSSRDHNGANGEQMFGSADKVPVINRDKTADDDVSSLRVDELLSLSDEPTGTAPAGTARTTGVTRPPQKYPTEPRRD